MKHYVSSKCPNHRGPGDFLSETCPIPPVPNGTFCSRVPLVATYATSGACASSRDALLSDSDLRAYGPCHRRDGTAGTPELLPQLSQPGLGTLSDDYGPAAIRRSKDLAAVAGARATLMSRLWAGDAAGGRGPERRRATGPTTTLPQELGRASVREHGTRSAVQVNSMRHVLGIYYSD